MKNMVQKYLRVCPKTRRIIGVDRLSGLSRLLFPLIGLAAMIWILIRVIPKPSRLTYPCMRAAMPLASGFIGYLAMLGLSAIAFLRFKKPLRFYPIFFVAAFAVFGISGFYLMDSKPVAQQIKNATVVANAPIGVAKGIIPGKVVWVHNPDAVNQNCVANRYQHAWFMSENMNQPAVDKMLSTALQNISGTTSDSAAWRMIFQYYNNTKHKGAVNYKSGEKIFIKINATSAWGGEYSSSDLSVTYNQFYGVSETSEATVLAVLRQLVNVVGVDQHNIYIGDPLKHIYKHLYDVWYGEFPDVHYLDNEDHSDLGREQVVPSTTAIIHYSDKGTVLRTNQMNPGSPGVPVLQDYLYTIFETADYIINIPQLKGHQRAGMTMFAKNHFGSHTRGDASHLHLGLVRPYGTADLYTLRSDYGMYRVQVDLMTHSLLSGKNLLYIMDALWGTDYELDVPQKWTMAPFNNSYSSSIFVSLDPVAIESVGYDFLRSEFTDERGLDASVQMDGVDDYLHQAADSTNWPVGIKYDPNNTGVHVYSLGVHEHWNNAISKQYSRNINPTSGTGINLQEIEQTGVAVNYYANIDNHPENFELYQNYPNPFNPSTTISYALPRPSSVEVSVYDIQGRQIKSYSFSSQSAGYQKVVWDGTNTLGNHVSSGIYIYRVKAASLVGGKKFEHSSKMVLMK